MSKYLRPRRGLANYASSQNIVLKSGEIFLEFPEGESIGKTPGRIVIGDGASSYSSLEYASTSSSDFQPFITDPSLYNPIFNNSTYATSGWTVNSATSSIDDIGDGTGDESLPNIIGSVKEALCIHEDSIHALNSTVSGAVVELTKEEYEALDNPDPSIYYLLTNVYSGGQSAQADWSQSDPEEADYIKNKPHLGSAAAKDVPTSGNASTVQVVMGNDTRLSDARTPLDHNHTVSEITDFPASMPASDVYSWAKESTKPTYNANEVSAVSIDANQNLTATQQSNARANIALGSAAVKNVALNGNASTTEVVMGNDSRLTDARNAADVYSWAKAENKPSYTANEISGLGSAATNNATTVVENGNSDLVTSGAVYTAINNLPEPMVFRGSLGEGGTITTLPVDGSAIKGDTYKVITAGTYAGISADIGDTFICETKTTDSNTWTHIPSGDEPSGTVTSVSVTNGDGISVSGGPITTSGTIIITNTGATGVKGDAENNYRTGNVNITPANIGLGNVGNFKAVSTDANQGLSSTEQSNARANISLDNVGNFKAVSTEASQGLSSTEQSNARANIGAGTSNFDGAYSSLSGTPTLGTVVSKNSTTAVDTSSDIPTSLAVKNYVDSAIQTNINDVLNANY